MKKVISILVSVALMLSCCSLVAFASDTELTAGNFAEYVGSTVTGGDEKFAEVMGNNGIDVTSIDPSMTLSTEQIYQFLEWFLDDGCLTPDQARNCASSFGSDFYNKLTDEQVAEIDGKIDAWDLEHNPPVTPPDDGGDDSGSGDSGDSGSGGLPFDIGDITDIFSNLGGNIDLSQFTEGAKSAIGQLIDGIKGAGLPDISSITGLLGGLGGGSDILGTIMGLLGLGGDSGDSGNSGNSGTNPYTPSTNPSGGNSNSQVIPKTADTAPIAAVAALAAVAGVAFVLTRKKNEN